MSLCFNSRTPGGVRPCRLSLQFFPLVFQFTHPGRGATSNSQKRFARVLFQFTHPGRGATCSLLSNCYTKSVSIHAPREGCDPFPSKTQYHGGRFNSRTPGGVRQLILRAYGRDRSFNSRTPGGVRPSVRHAYRVTHQFQFTHPGRGATWCCYGCRLWWHVSIHAPREGCDS